MHTPPPQSLRKILVSPPLSETLSKMGTPPKGVGSLSGQHGRIARKGHPERQGNCVQEIFCFVLFLFLCVKNGYPPPRSLCKILVPPPSETSSETGTPPSKRTTPPLTRNSEQSLMPLLNSTDLKLG